MILVTVGTQLPYDRLIKSIDVWAGDNDFQNEIIAQTGKTVYKSINIKSKEFFSPVELDNYFEKCELIISHAGVGTILNALRKTKPIIIMPRKYSLGEHRNDHQLATARYFSNYSGVYVANDAVELHKYLNEKNNLSAGESIGQYASAELINYLKDAVFIKD